MKPIPLPGAMLQAFVLPTPKLSSSLRVLGVAKKQELGCLSLVGREHFQDIAILFGSSRCDKDRIDPECTRRMSILRFVLITANTQLRQRFPLISFWTFSTLILFTTFQTSGTAGDQQVVRQEIPSRSPFSCCHQKTQWEGHGFPECSCWCFKLEPHLFFVSCFSCVWTKH